jgi:beta-galactosidase/beta-glucuronidase
MSIHTSLEIVNSTNSEIEADIKLTIIDQNDIAKIIERTGLIISANAKIKTDILENWDDPILWDIVNPHLYKMKIE